MLTLSSIRRQLPDGVRFELLLTGPSVPERLNTNPIFFELYGTSPHLVLLDGMVQAIIHFAMQRHESVHVLGRLSHRALRNLHGYQTFWHLMRPERYSVIDITAEEIVPDGSQRQEPASAVAAYSGGVDSTFTIIRHRHRLAGIGTFPLDAVMLVQGFDVGVDDFAGFDRLRARLQPMISELGLQLCVTRTNVKEIKIQDWEDSFAALLISCLNLTSHHHSIALLATDGFDETYVMPWGGNGISVPLLTSGGMRVVYDAPEVSRTEKVALLSQFASARRALRVCWQGTDAGANCGRCEKCVRTYLNFRAVGIANPECFDVPMSDDALNTIEITNPREESFMRELARAMVGKAELSELMSQIELQLTRYDELRATRRAFRSKHAWRWAAAKLWSRLATIYKTE
jgi:hypothetical protein